MFNRIKRGYAPRTRSNTPQYSTCQTSQQEPNLHDILVAYQHGDDVSEFLRIPAAKATAEQQFKNRFGKVDPLTEIQDYVKQETIKANAAVKADKLKQQEAAKAASSLSKTETNS